VNAFIPALANMLAMQVMCGMTGFLLCHIQGREWRARARFFAGEYTNRNGDTAGTTNTLSAFTLPQPRERVESTRKASSACEYTKRNVTHDAHTGGLDFDFEQYSADRPQYAA
jgi:hypothetical protein